MANHKLTKTELKKNGLYEIFKRWQQLCLDGNSFEYGRNIVCAIELYENVEVSDEFSDLDFSDLDFKFKESDMYYEHLDDKLPVLSILSGICYYYRNLSYITAFETYIEKTATVRQYENYKVLLHGISKFKEIDRIKQLTKRFNDFSQDPDICRVVKRVFDLFDIYDWNKPILEMESLYKLLQTARKDAAEEKLRELIPLPNSESSKNITDSKDKPLTISDRAIKEAISDLFVENEEKGCVMLKYSYQWYAVMRVLADSFNYPNKPTAFFTCMKDLGFNQEDHKLALDSIKKAHGDVPLLVGLVPSQWKIYEKKGNQYKNQCDVAYFLMRRLDVLSQS